MIDASIPDLGAVSRQLRSFVFAVLREIEQRRGIVISPESIPLDDPSPFLNLSTSGLSAVFNAGFADLLCRLGPNRMPDLTAAFGLYRPGPLEVGSVDSFFRVRRGQLDRTQVYPRLSSTIAPLLDETGGVILFRDQLERILVAVFKVEPAQTPEVLTGLSPSPLANSRESTLLSGNHILPDGTARELLWLIRKHCGKVVPKGICAACGRTTYQAAYLQAHFPAEFAATIQSGLR